MFDRIAGVYDLLNTVMTAGLHHQWRRRAVDLAAVAPGDRVLDVATGTGDLAFELARRVAPGGSVVASDFSEQMLSIARDKARARGPGAPELCASSRPTRFCFPIPMTVRRRDRRFWCPQLLRPRTWLCEMARVVRPGGHVVVLEMTTPQRPPLSLFFKLWFDRAVPALGRLAGDPAAYAYLPSSVSRFPGPQALAATMTRCGLAEIRYILTAGGIIALHVGTVAA